METNSNRSKYGESHFVERKFRQFEDFLQALQDAREYARDLRCSARDFAISFSDAKAMGVCSNDLLWMMRKGWIEACGVGHVDFTRVQSNTVATSAFSAQSQFLIGEFGLEAVRVFSERQSKEVEGQEDCPQLTTDFQLPLWDSERHELSYHGQLVKRFRWPATNQEIVLSAFQEDAWPSRIDDPLPGTGGLEPKRRLSDTIKCLNRNHRVPLLRFRGDGTGEGIIWDIARR